MANPVGLPDGFQLDQPGPQSIPGLPAGFSLDQQPKGVLDKLGQMWEHPPEGPSLIGLARKGYDAITGAVDSANALYPQSLQITEQQAQNINTAREALPVQTFEAAQVTSPVTPTMRNLQIGKQTVEQIAAPSGQELKSAATGVAGYNNPKANEVHVAPQAMRDFANNLRTQLADKGLDADVSPKVDATLQRLINSPDDAAFTGKNFRSLQRKLGNLAGNKDEKPAAMDVLNALNKHVENLTAKDLVRGTPEDAAALSGLYKEANANYAAYKRSQTIQGKAERGELNAETANSGYNLDNALRQQVKSILTNPKLLRGFSDDEKSAMMQIAKGSAPANIIRDIGNRLGGGGGMGSLHAAAAGAYVGGGVGAIAAPLAGWALKKAGNAITAKNVAKLDELVRSRSPLAQQQFQKAIREAGGKNANSLQLLMSAAMLQDPTGKLNRAIANMFRGGTVPAAADGDQSQAPRL